MTHALRRHLAVLLLVAACGGPPLRRPADPMDATLLARPFTAEEIRAEWIEGLEVVMQTTTGETTERELWRVVEHGPDTVRIAFVDLDAPDAQEREQEFRWEELRDHAAYPRAFASRVPATFDTALGPLTGWLYVVDDPDAGRTHRSFFAERFPGAPVVTETLENGQVVSRTEQVERRRPD